MAWGGVISSQEEISSKIGKYREMRRDKWTTRRWKFLGEQIPLRRCGIELTNLSESLRSEIKLFSCNFYDMYPFPRSKRSMRLERRGETSETNLNIEVEHWRLSRSAASDRGKGLFQGTMKMEHWGNWVDLSLRKIFKETDTILSRFRSNEFLDLVVINIDDFHETTVSNPLLADNEVQRKNPVLWQKILMSKILTAVPKGRC